jgi:two-component system sensor histidine kinase KdpD
MTGVAAAVDAAAPAAGLGVLYLLAVLFIAMRHGERAALVTALLASLAFNFFFLEPRYQFGINSAANVVTLVVLTIASVTVGRLAEQVRQQAVTAHEAARLAQERERENALVAAAASALLEGTDLNTGRQDARIELASAPAPREGELPVRLPTKEKPAWLYVAAEPSGDPGARARVAEVLARLVDVSVERKRIDAQATEVEATKRADIAKTAILHAISHDLRSPLTAIITAAGALQRGPADPADRKELAAVIAIEADRLARLIDDLLDLSRIEAGAVETRPDWCDLQEIVASASARAPLDHPIELALDGLPLVKADHVQIERVFANLIENACLYSTPGRPVRVSGSVAGERVLLRVTNEGPTIPRAARLRIFEPFARAGQSRGGSGLGLAICRGFVEANGGSITLQSGSGETSFTVSLPLTRAEVPA